jgi:hypothetical protein
MGEKGIIRQTPRGKTREADELEVDDETLRELAEPAG